MIFFSDNDKLLDEDFEINYIKMSEVKLQFTHRHKENPEEKLSFKLVDLKEVDSLSKVSAQESNSTSQRTPTSVIPKTQTDSCSTSLKLESEEQSCEIKPAVLTLEIHDGEPVEKKLKLPFGICPFCDKEIDSEYGSNSLTEKGLASIIDSMLKKNDTSRQFYKGQRVHQVCRQDYINPYRNALFTPENKQSSDQFDFDNHCLFCGGEFDEHRKAYRYRKANLKSSLLKACEKRKDKLAKDVKERLDLVDNICLANVGYHFTCNSSFHKTGRPVDNSAENAFQDVVQYVKENCGKKLIVKDLVKYMAEKLQNAYAEPYSHPWMKKKFID